MDPTASLVIGFVIGLLCGGGAAIWISRNQESQRDAYRSLSREIVKENKEEFLQLAETSLKTQREQGTAELEQQKQAIDMMVKPLKEQLHALREMTTSLESVRKEDQGKVSQELHRLADLTSALNISSTSLRNALEGSSQARGRWGEVALRNIVETSGMTLHVDYDEQQGTGGVRPDMVIHLPGEGHIPVDSKVPLKDYLAACSAQDPVRRKEHLVNHARAVMQFVRELGKRKYAQAVGGSVDFTIMFIPGEPILAGAYETEEHLFERAWKEKILIATPVTLIALLRTISIYWEKVKVKESTEQLWKAGVDLYDRVVTFTDHLSKVGRGIQSSLDAYNAAVASFETRVQPGGRKMMEIGLTSPSALESPQRVEGAPREITPAKEAPPA